MANGRKTTDIPFIKTDEQVTSLSEDKDHIPTSGQTAIIKALQKKAEKFGLEGVQVGLFTNPDLRKKLPYAARNMRERGNILFADPASALRAYVNGATVEGPFRHEYGHIKRGNQQNYDKLIYVLTTIVGVSQINGVLSGNGGGEAENKVASAIIRQFGSLDNFRAALNEFEANSMKVLDEARSRVKPEILSASPETLALLMEENTLDYLLLKNSMDGLPPVKSLQKLAVKCSASVPEKDTPTESSQAVLDSELKKQLSRIAWETSRFEIFVNLIKAEEYVVDGDVVRNSRNPIEAMQGLIYMINDLIEQEIRKRNIPSSKAGELTHKAMSTDTALYPAPNKRIERMAFITEHGCSPSEAEMIQLMENREKRETRAVEGDIKLPPGNEIEKPITPPIIRGNKDRSR